jgi:hypothetical protein
MTGAQLGRVQLLAVIVHHHQVLVDGWFDDRRRQRVLGEMKLRQRARIVRRIIGNVTQHHGRMNQFAKIVEPAFEGRDAQNLAAMVGGPHHIQQEPETGHQSDGRKRQNCKLMARQADQFNTDAALFHAGCVSFGTWESL